MATSEDIDVATREDFFMATDSRRPQLVAGPSREQRKVAQYLQAEAQPDTAVSSSLPTSSKA
jgi:hypothetical protein